MLYIVLDIGVRYGIEMTMVMHKHWTNRELSDREREKEQLNKTMYWVTKAKTSRNIKYNTHSNAES